LIINSQKLTESSEFAILKLLEIFATKPLIHKGTKKLLIYSG